MNMVDRHRCKKKSWHSDHVRLQMMESFQKNTKKLRSNQTLEGKMKEVEDGLDSLDDILLEVGERSNKAGGGLAYMLGE